MKIGDDSVVIGNIGENENIGNRSVRIGATDANGNTILRPDAGGMAIGYGAKAGAYSIAIGAHAGAGLNTISLLEELKSFFEEKDILAAQNVSDIITEIRKDTPNSNSISNLWGAVELAAATSGAIDLVHKIYPHIQHFIK